MLAFRKHLLSFSMGRIVLCLLTYYFLESLPSILKNTSFLSIYKKRYFIRSNMLCIMLNKLKNTLITVSTKLMLCYGWYYSTPHQKPQVTRHLQVSTKVYGPPSSKFFNIYRTYYLFPGYSTNHSCCLSWFYTSLFKPDGPQPAGSPAPEDNSYKFEAILQIKKLETHAKMKLIGYIFFPITNGLSSPSW